MNRHKGQSIIILMFFILISIITNAAVHAADDISVPILVADLSGDNGVLPDETAAQGRIAFQLSDDGSGLYYKLSVDSVEKVTAAHIYLAPEGETPRVIVTLFDLKEIPRIGNFNGRSAEGTITAGKLVGPLVGSPLSTLLREIGEGHTYVNVITEKHPQGHIRGRIVAPLN